MCVYILIYIHVCVWMSIKGITSTRIITVTSVAFIRGGSFYLPGVVFTDEEGPLRDE